MLWALSNDFLEIIILRQSSFMGPCFKSYLSCNFDQPERIHDRAIVNLAGHHFQRLSENKIILSPHINQKLFVGREVVSLSCTSYMGEQWWCSGQSTRFPPMWPGYESWRWRHMWLEFVVGSLLCSKRFFSGYSGFPLSLKKTFQIPIRSGTHGHILTSS